MKSKSTMIILLLLVAALAILSQSTQYDEKLIDYLQTVTHAMTDSPSQTNDEDVEIQSRYVHMADDLANSGLNAGQHS